jgi:phage shock protein PspC (stress-responsive transcriptional regulator)
MPYHNKVPRQEKLKVVALVVFLLAVVAIAAYIIYLVVASPAQSYL